MKGIAWRTSVESYKEAGEALIHGESTACFDEFKRGAKMYAKVLICGVLTSAVLIGAGFKASRQTALTPQAGVSLTPTANDAVAGGFIRYSKGRWVLFKKVSPRNPVDVPVESKSIELTNISLDTGDGVLALTSTN